MTWLAIIVGVFGLVGLFAESGERKTLGALLLILAVLLRILAVLEQWPI